jgi:hypothetical protein
MSVLRNILQLWNKKDAAQSGPSKAKEIRPERSQACWQDSGGKFWQMYKDHTGKAHVELFREYYSSETPEYPGCYSKYLETLSLSRTDVKVLHEMLMANTSETE